MKVCYLSVDENNESYVKKIDIESPTDYELKVSEMPDKIIKDSIFKALKNNENGGKDFGQTIDEVYVNWLVYYKDKNEEILRSTIGEVKNGK